MKNTYFLLLLLSMFSCTHTIERNLESGDRIYFAGIQNFNPSKNKFEIKLLDIKPQLLKKYKALIFPDTIMKIAMGLNEEYQVEHHFIETEFYGIDIENLSNKKVLTNFSNILVVQKQEINIEELLYKQKLRKIYSPYLYTVCNLYSISHQNEQYLLVVLNGLLKHSGEGWAIPILIKLGQEKNIPIVLAGKDGIKYEGTARHGYPTYLGDFDQDGQLDYLHHSSDNELQLYNIKENNLVKKNGAFQKIHKSRDAKSFCKKYYLDKDELTWKGFFYNGEVICDSVHHHLWLKTLSSTPYLQ